MSKRSSDRDEDPYALWHLSSLHSSAVRGYYTYAYLRKLLRSQEKTVWEDLSTVFGIVASVISIFAIIQNPTSVTVVLTAYLLAILVIVGVTIYQKRSRHENGLDDAVYLGIYLDEASNFMHEIELAQSYRQSKEVQRFTEDRKDALRGSLAHLQTKIAKLRAKQEYPSCLGRIGRSEEWVKSLSDRVKAILGSGLLE